MLFEQKLRCPDDVSVMGFNDMPYLDKLRPPLSTVRLPHYRIGAEAARLLLDRIADPTSPSKSIVLPVALVPRQSTAARVLPRAARARRPAAG